MSVGNGLSELRRQILASDAAAAEINEVVRRLLLTGALRAFTCAVLWAGLAVMNWRAGERNWATFDGACVFVWLFLAAVDARRSRIPMLGPRPLPGDETA